MDPFLHNNLEGGPVEQHPQVSSLITGLFNNRPLLSRYNFIWAVQLVLDYLKKNFQTIAICQINF